MDGYLRNEPEERHDDGGSRDHVDPLSQRRNLRVRQPKVK